MDPASEGEDIARENWSMHERKTPPHALSGVQGQDDAGRRSRRQDAGRVGTAAQQPHVHPNQITDWKNQLSAKAADVFGDELRPDEAKVDLKGLHAKIEQLALENDF